MQGFGICQCGKGYICGVGVGVDRLENVGCFVVVVSVRAKVCSAGETVGESRCT